MLERTSRYLTAFHPKRVPHRFADVIIIGGGLAGLRAALAVPESQSVLVITKGGLRQSNSNYAQGGIAGVLDPEDRFEDHIADTLKAGGNLCDPDVVEFVVREAPAADQRTDRVGHEFRPGRRRAGAGSRRGPQPPSHRARARATPRARK